jgi:hypothetical protein
MKYVDRVKRYLTPSDGQRALYFVLDMPSVDNVAVVTEPPWLDSKADVEMTPAMTGANLKKAGPNTEKLLRDETSL